MVSTVDILSLLGKAETYGCLISNSAKIKTNLFTKPTTPSSTVEKLRGLSCYGLSIIIKKNTNTKFHKHFKNNIIFSDMNKTQIIIVISSTYYKQCTYPYFYKVFNFILYVWDRASRSVGPRDDPLYYTYNYKFI